VSFCHPSTVSGGEISPSIDWLTEHSVAFSTLLTKRAYTVVEALFNGRVKHYILRRIVHDDDLVEKVEVVDSLDIRCELDEYVDGGI
jgi:hypothetical protein